MVSFLPQQSRSSKGLVNSNCSHQSCKCYACQFEKFCGCKSIHRIESNSSGAKQMNCTIDQLDKKGKNHNGSSDQDAHGNPRFSL